MSGTTISPEPSSMSSSSIYTDFVPVTRKKRRNRIPNEKLSLSATLKQLRDELGQDDWLYRCQQVLIDSIENPTTPFKAPPEEVLCLGLGSPSASLNARVQLAFLLSVCEHLNIDHTKVSIYDPVFTAEDVTLFSELQLQLITENKGAAYALGRSTLCFMPHCDMELYENILKANWTKARLPNVLLVANRLTDYVDSNPAHKLATRVPIILELAPLLQCHDFPASLMWPTAFNNMAVQFVSDPQTASLSLPG